MSNAMPFLNLCFNSIYKIPVIISDEDLVDKIFTQGAFLHLQMYLPNFSHYRDAQLSPSSAGGVMAFAIPCYFYPIQSSLVC